MHVILLDNIDKLGKLGDVCDVRAGYARNYLFPQEKALPATEESKKIYEERRAELEKRIVANQELTGQQVEKAKGVRLGFKRRAGEEGKLYGSVTLDDVAKELSAKNVGIAKRQIIMPDGTLRHTGEYSIQLRFDAENVVDVPLEILPETGYQSDAEKKAEKAAKAKKLAEETAKKAAGKTEEKPTEEAAEKPTAKTAKESTEETAEKPAKKAKEDKPPKTKLESKAKPKKGE